MVIEDSYARLKKEEKGAERAFQKQERYRIGKLEEVRIAKYIADIGYKVTDISKERIGEYRYWSPFDILAESEYYSFFADVKYRSSRGPVPIDTEKVDWWLAYERPDTKVDDRIVIVCSPGRQDSFISVKDLQEFYMFRGAYVMPRECFKSIVILRKILEHAHRDSND